MTSREKKQVERRLIEEARRRTNLLPNGTLSEYESPDWLIPDSSLAIEVSAVLPPKGDNLFSGAQLSSWQIDVVARAQQHYFSAYDTDADILVFFDNEWNRRRRPEAMAQALAGFVNSNLPQDSDCVTLQRYDTDQWVDGVSVIRIARTGRQWQAGSAADIHELRQVDLAAQIDSKNKLVERYRSRLPGWSIWLLLTTEIQVLRSVAIPRDVGNWRFTFDFDRVLLMPWDGNVIQIRSR
jgi:hypothetical protein